MTGELAVAYLYADLPPDERERFEDHLLACERCRDEFAELSASRYEVFEWHKLEFVPMETPRIVIPYEPEKAGWFAGLRESFAFSQRLLAGSAAGMLAAVVLLMVAFWNSEATNTPIAADHGSDRTAVELAGLRHTEPVEEDDQAVEMNDVAPALESVNGNIEPETVNAAYVPRKDTPRNIPRRPVRRVSPGNEPAVIQASAPRLNDFEDTSDESLRLSDMFDDIEMLEQ